MLLSWSSLCISLIRVQVLHTAMSIYLQTLLRQLTATYIINHKGPLRVEDYATK